MSLLGKSVSITRFNVGMPPAPDWGKLRFYEIEQGSEVRERVGIVPFDFDDLLFTDVGSPYHIGMARWVFRLRVDKRTPDATAVKERVRQLVKVEVDAGVGVTPKKRRQFKTLAEAESLLGQKPKTTLVECVIEKGVLYVASTAKSLLGLVVSTLRQAGIVTELKTPWLDEAPPEGVDASDIVDVKEPGQSVLGCRFFSALMEDPEVMVEPEAGSVHLRTREAGLRLSGAVLNDLHRYVEEGAEVLSAKIILGAVPMRFDAFSYRISGMKLGDLQGERWHERLNQRLEQLTAIWGKLDEKYAATVQKTYTFAEGSLENDDARELI
jgi:hypothetical protein